MLELGKQVVTVHHCDPPMIELHGALDFFHAAEIRDAVRRVLCNVHTDLSIDCSDIEMMDSSGLSALIEAWRLTEAVGGGLRLISPSDHLLYILRLTGLARYFEIVHAEPAHADPHLSLSERWRTSIFSIPARAEALAEVRYKIAALSRTMPFTEQQIDDIKFAVGEAISNAIRHGSPRGASNKVTIRCERTNDRFIVQISDEGHGFDPEDRDLAHPGLLVENGRGIFFMKTFVDEVAFTFCRGTTVRLVKRVSAY